MKTGIGTIFKSIRTAPYDGGLWVQRAGGTVVSVRLGWTGRRYPLTPEQLEQFRMKAPTIGAGLIIILGYNVAQMIGLPDHPLAHFGALVAALLVAYVWPVSREETVFRELFPDTYTTGDSARPGIRYLHYLGYALPLPAVLIIGAAGLVTLVLAMGHAHAQFMGLGAFAVFFMLMPLIIRAVGRG